MSINADQTKYFDLLASRDLGKLKLLAAGYQLLFIDEAQRIPEIGLNLKILADNLPDLKVIATGSSSFDLANKVSEPLTGRVWTYTLYPISLAELKSLYSPFELNEHLEEYLIYGSYPEVLTLASWQKKRQLLAEIEKSSLYKDALELTTIKYARKIKNLLKLLAFQIGSEVSLTELSASLNLSREAVERYLDLLEKSFVIFRLSGFSRNLRKEVSKMDKFYFYDLGIRNEVVDNFKPLADRNDCGQLWENFLMIERKKYLAYGNFLASTYFWRTHTGAEIDYVEEKEGRLFGYEFKWGRRAPKVPTTFLSTYANV
ncbi:MAG: ATP-binding protein [Candidatus Shapirobacteria bacterium]